MTIQFGEACKDIFKTENKWMTILGLSVCMLIPIVGPMVIFGFIFRRFARERQGHPAEDFDFNFFGDYLKMGLWPVLASIVFSLFIIPVVIAFGILPAVIIPLAENGNEAAIIAIASVGFLVYMAFIIVFTVLSYAVLLRSGLMMDFKAGFSWSFMKSFVSKVGMSFLGYTLLLALIAIPLVLVGYLALIVGVYAVAAWMQFAMMHLAYQHYDLLVERGGEKIEVNPELTQPLGAPPIPAPATASDDQPVG